MKERGRYLYQNPDGTIFIKFEHPGTGVPIESLLPECGRGDGFADFRVRDYFDLADLVLAAPKDWAEFCRTTDVAGATKANPKKVPPPAPNLGFLKLRDGDGLNQEQAKALFAIVAAYWSAPKNTMALEPGLVAALWHSGMTAGEIIAYVRRFTNADGKLYCDGFLNDRGFQILHAVIQAYKAGNALAADTVLTQDKVTSLLKTWLRATRAVDPGSPEIGNAVLHRADYRRLRLVDTAGRAPVDHVATVARHVFASKPTPTFADLSLWVDAHLSERYPNSSTPDAANRSRLKKRRKQGRLNRKRGRR